MLFKGVLPTGKCSELCLKNATPMNATKKVTNSINSLRRQSSRQERHHSSCLPCHGSFFQQQCTAHNKASRKKEKVGPLFQKYLVFYVQPPSLFYWNFPLATNTYDPLVFFLMSSYSALMEEYISPHTTLNITNITEGNAQAWGKFWLYTRSCQKNLKEFLRFISSQDGNGARRQAQIPLL